MKYGDDEKWDPYEEEEILESIEEDGPDDVRRKFQQAKSAGGTPASAAGKPENGDMDRNDEKRDP